jgi:RND superfamily putative drug exporter
MATLARWCVRHRFIVLTAWLVVLVGLAVGSRALGSGYTSGFSLPGTESAQAQQLLNSSGTLGQSGGNIVVVHVKDGSLTDATTRLLGDIAKVPGVSAVGRPQTSPDGHTAIAGINLTKDNQALTLDDVQPVVDAGAKLRGPNADVEFGGAGFQTLKGRPASGSTAIGLIAAAIVLLIAFGSLLSMAIPLVAAVFALGGAIEAIGLISHATEVDSIAPTIAALIGLGVGVDYALFIVTRHRNELRGGLTVEESAVRAVSTAGRAVLFAGGTVAIAMLGLILLGINFLTGIGIAAAAMVGFAVLAAVTLLPAMFGIVGTRVLSRRERRRALNIPAVEGFWARWARFVEGRPVILSVVAAAIMLVLAIPAFSLHLGSADQGNDAAHTTTRKAYDLVASGFGAGFNGPLVLAAQSSSPADDSALTRLATTLKSTPGVASVAQLPRKPGSDVAVLQVVPTTSPQSDATADLIDRLRHTVIRNAEAGTTLHVYVGGQTAIFEDFGAVLADHLPLFIGVVVLLGCVLLMIAFRSIVIPLTAAAMNLLAAGASFGVVVAVFQWGWGSEALSLGKGGPIESFLPVMLLAILFGLSMDYQVFLVSRMHEEWVHSGDNRRAVRAGQAATGRVITAAAAIMVCVFLAFVLGGRRPIGEFGLGLATAILLDALILRTVLVPAAMQLFGRANWTIPRWLDRILPHVSVDVPEAPAPTPPAPVLNHA